ncbi:MAG TPA: hypothetical protein VKE49_09510 [Myxococcaceae bacterium]|nr:hypothetical protein [Myxococcaceae bacterium]
MRTTKRKLSRSKGLPVQIRGRSAAATGPQYKVVELSIVDEISLEQALNQWTRRGWRFDGIHFAMRDSSKRPAMAFLLFTRPDGRVAEEESRRVEDVEHVSTDPWRRLRELAGVQAEDDEPADPTSE